MLVRFMCGPAHGVYLVYAKKPLMQPNDCYSDVTPKALRPCDSREVGHTSLPRGGGYVGLMSLIPEGQMSLSSFGFLFLSPCEITLLHMMHTAFPPSQSLR